MRKFRRRYPSQALTFKCHCKSVSKRTHQTQEWRVVSPSEYGRNSPLPHVEFSRMRRPVDFAEVLFSRRFLLQISAYRPLPQALKTG